MAWFSPKSLLIPDILAQNQAYLSSKPAIVIDDNTTTWAEFDDGIARFANALLGTGLEHRDRVIGTVFIDELPRNPNGKILKRELRTIYAEATP